MGFSFLISHLVSFGDRALKLRHGGGRCGCPSWLPAAVCSESLSAHLFYTDLLSIYCVASAGLDTCRWAKYTEFSAWKLLASWVTGELQAGQTAGNADLFQEVSLAHEDYYSCMSPSWKRRPCI